MASVATPPDDDLPLAFRAAMRRLASTVAVVTARGPDGPVGMAATSITSLTVDPPSVLFCVNRAASLHACLIPGAPINLSLLSRHQRDVSVAFGGGVPRHQRFDVGLWRYDRHDLPTLSDAQANLACEVDQMVPYATHSIVIARVRRASVSPAVAPLIYQDGAYL